MTTLAAPRKPRIQSRQWHDHGRQLHRFGWAPGTHQSQINFNGGVLAANASDPGGSYFLPALAGLTAAVDLGWGGD
jgi:hypothetical protein